jgi:hypothetical protein
MARESQSRLSQAARSSSKLLRDLLFVNHYSSVRLHSAIGYVIPADHLAGRQHPGVH